MEYLLMKMYQKNILVALLILLVIAGCENSKQADEQGSEKEASAGENGDDEGFVEIFDGKSLQGWEGDTTYWRVEDGALVGEITPSTLLKTNSFIVWQGGSPADFELIAEFRITENGNSGIQYRSEKLTDVANALRGYQADIDGKNNYTGQNYEERGRTTLAYRGEQVTVSTQPHPEKEGSLREHVKNNAWTQRQVTGSLGSQDSLRALIKNNDWNTCRIVARGNRLQHFINGVLMSEVTDDDTANRKMSGHLGVQVHVGPPMKVEYRNIRLKQL